MDKSKLTKISGFQNNTKSDMTLYLEMNCEEISIKPNEKVDLLANIEPDDLPIDINYVDGGLQIHPCKGNPEWRIMQFGEIESASKIHYGASWNELAENHIEKQRWWKFW